MRYLIDGCYGDGNVGDECLLQAMLRVIRRQDADAEIRVLSADVPDTERRHGVPAIAQCNPFGRNLYGSLAKGLLARTWREIRSCDLFLLGGGELFRDQAGLSATLGICYRMRLARLLNKPVLALGMGCQTPDRWWGGLVLRSALNIPDQLLFRDPRGLAIARQLAGPDLRADWAPDPVFSLDWQPLPAPRPTPGPAGALQLGVSVKSLPARHPAHGTIHHRLPDVLLQTLVSLSRRRPIRVSLLPFSGEDLGLAEQLAERFQAFQPTVCQPQAAALRTAISALDVLLAVPLHASVFGFALGVPTVGVAYDPKVRRLYEHFEAADHCLALHDLEHAAVLQRVQQVQGVQGASAAGPALGRRLQRRAHAAGVRFHNAASRLLAQVIASKRDARDPSRPSRRAERQDSQSRPVLNRHSAACSDLPTPREAVHEL